MILAFFNAGIAINSPASLIASRLGGGGTFQFRFLSVTQNKRTADTQTRTHMEGGG